MARTEARIFTSIWKDEDFLTLPPSAQRLYFFLISQEELTYCGVIPLRERRWAPKAAGLTVSDIEQDLKALEASDRRFVITDYDTGELLIRSFMRRDELWRQPNLMKAARAAAALVESAVIRAAILAELHRIPAAGSSSRLVREVHAAFVNDLADPSANPSGNSSPNPGTPHSVGETAGQEANGNPSNNPSGNPSGEAKANSAPDPKAIPSQERGDGYGGNQEGLLTPSSILTGDAKNPSGKGSEKTSANPSTTDQLIADWLDHVRKRPPGNVIGQVGKLIKVMLDEGIDASDIRAGVALWARKGIHPSALPSCVNEVMNASSDAAARSPGERKGREAIGAGQRVQAMLDEGTLKL